jgi:hypothetical protein
VYIVFLGAQLLVVGCVAADGQECRRGFAPELAHQVVFCVGGSDEFEGAGFDPHVSEDNILVDGVDPRGQASCVKGGLLVGLLILNIGVMIMDGFINR